jgi:thioester reductase-like protein
MVVHNAWTVHFNHPLASFESQIAGTRSLLDFCLALDHQVKFLFVSSVGVAQSWNGKNGPVPEAILEDPAVAAGNGYSASKYIVEHVSSS